MQHLGRILRKQRELMGITLRQAEEDTKISIRYLRSIEEGNFDVIPGGQFYLKGFLKTYGDYIRLDGPAVVKYYLELREQQGVSGGHTADGNLALRQSLFPDQKGGVFRTLYRTLVSFM